MLALKTNTAEITKKNVYTVDIKIFITELTIYICIFPINQMLIFSLVTSINTRQGQTFPIDNYTRLKSMDIEKRHVSLL